MTLLGELRDLRTEFLAALKGQVLFEREFTDKLRPIVGTSLLPPGQTSTVNVADVSNYVSARIGWEWARRLPGPFHAKKILGQTAGERFTTEVRRYIESAIGVAQILRKTDWKYTLEVTTGSTRTQPKNPRIKASKFAQYRHLDAIKEVFERRPDLEAVFGSDYIVEPDIVVFSEPMSIDALGGRPESPISTFSPLLSDAQYGGGAPILHASVSCKLTIRSDRAQNARLEALNLIRTRKGRTPNIAFVTAEPLPSRISSLALGTGDVDCIYHAGLYELVDAVDAATEFGAKVLPMNDTESVADSRLSAPPEDEADADAGAAEAVPTKAGLARQRARLNSMIAQGRLRDISDLPLDLLI